MFISLLAHITHAFNTDVQERAIYKLLYSTGNTTVSGENRAMHGETKSIRHVDRTKISNRFISLLFHQDSSGNWTFMTGGGSKSTVSMTCRSPGRSVSSMSSKFS